MDELTGGALLLSTFSARYRWIQEGACYEMKQYPAEDRAECFVQAGLLGVPLVTG